MPTTSSSMRIPAAGLIALGAMTRAEGIHRQPGKHLVFPASPTQRAGGLDTKAVFPHCENAVCLHPCATVAVATPLRQTQLVELNGSSRPEAMHLIVAARLPLVSLLALVFLTGTYGRDTSSHIVSREPCAHPLVPTAFPEGPWRIGAIMGYTLPTTFLLCRIRLSLL